MVRCLLLPGRNAGLEVAGARGGGGVVKQPPGSTYIAQRLSKRPADQDGTPGRVC